MLLAKALPLQPAPLALLGPALVSYCHATLARVGASMRTKTLHSLAGVGSSMGTKTVCALQRRILLKGPRLQAGLHALGRRFVGCARPLFGQGVCVGKEIWIARGVNPKVSAIQAGRCRCRVVSSVERQFYLNALSVINGFGQCVRALQESWKSRVRLMQSCVRKVGCRTYSLPCSLAGLIAEVVQSSSEQRKAKLFKTPQS